MLDLHSLATAKDEQTMLDNRDPGGHMNAEVEELGYIS